MRRLFARFIISAVYLFSGHVATRLVRPSLPLRAGRVADRSGVGTERPRNPTDLMYE